MKPLYLAFYGDQYYPGEGLRDCFGIFQDQTNALEACRERMAEDHTLKWAAVWCVLNANGDIIKRQVAYFDYEYLMGPDGKARSATRVREKIEEIQEVPA